MKIQQALRSNLLYALLVTLSLLIGIFFLTFQTNHFRTKQVYLKQKFDQNLTFNPKTIEQSSLNIELPEKNLEFIKSDFLEYFKIQLLDKVYLEINFVQFEPGLEINDVQSSNLTRFPFERGEIEKNSQQKLSNIGNINQVNIYRESGLVEFFNTYYLNYYSEFSNNLLSAQMDFLKFNNPKYDFIEAKLKFDTTDLDSIDLENIFSVSDKIVLSISKKQ